MNDPGKIIVDENLSYKILTVLKGFEGSIHVNEIGLNESLDKDIWTYAKKEGFCILTRDIDFYTVSILLGCPPKIIHLLTPSQAQSTLYFKNKLENNLRTISRFLKTDDLCYLRIE